MSHHPLQVFRFGNQRDPDLRVLVLAGIHGNESAGIEAARNFISQLQNPNQILSLLKESLTIIPICNPLAYEKKIRHIGEDLNRYLEPRLNPSTELDFIRNQLCAEIKGCDILLDLHTLYSSQVPFAFLGPPNILERELALSLGVEYFVEGWQQAHKNSNFPQLPDQQSMGTAEYARLNGAVAITLECGHHSDPKAPEIGLRAIYGLLNHLQMIENSEHVPKRKNPNHVRLAQLQKTYFMLKDGQLADKKQNFDPIKQGEILAIHDDGTVIRAEEDGFLIMPDPRMRKSKNPSNLPEEWFYTGIAKKFH
jgi:succinylglutamate desuccinylase